MKIPCIQSARIATRIPGFTLTEMLIVLLLLALLAAIATPGLARMLERHRLASIGNNLLILVMLARNEALQRSTRVTLCHTANPEAPVPACAPAGASWADGVMVFVDDGTRSPAQPASRAALLRISGPIEAHYSLLRKGVNSASLSFAASGRLKSGTIGTSFDISGPSAEREARGGEAGEHRCLVIAITGRARLTGEACE